MTPQPNLEAAVEAVPSRPVKEALAEIAGVSLVCVFVAFAGLGLVVSVARGFPEEDLLTQVTKAAPVAGGEVLDHIGWGFGVDITVMLSFYAIVIGGQLIGSPAATSANLGLLLRSWPGCSSPRCCSSSPLVWSIPRRPGPCS